MRRWYVVGGVGIVCGALDGGLFYALTGAVVPALVVALLTAGILVVLAVGGARYNRTFQPDGDRRAAAMAKHDRVRKAIEDTHRRR